MTSSVADRKAHGRERAGDILRAATPDARAAILIVADRAFFLAPERGPSGPVVNVTESVCMLAGAGFDPYCNGMVLESDVSRVGERKAFRGEAAKAYLDACKVALPGTIPRPHVI